MSACVPPPFAAVESSISKKQIELFSNSEFSGLVESEIF